MAKDRTVVYKEARGYSKSRLSLSARVASIYICCDSRVLLQKLAMRLRSVVRKDDFLHFDFRFQVDRTSPQLIYVRQSFFHIFNIQLDSFEAVTGDTAHRACRSRHSLQR